MSAQETINKALALHQAGALDEAIAEYRLALDRSGGHPAAANLLAVALDEHGRTDEARSVLSDALAGLPKDDPGGYEPALNLARLLVRDNAVLEAAGPLGRAAAVEPDGTTEARGLLFQVAMALLSSDLAEKAAAALLRDESGAAIIGQAIGIAEGAGATGIAMAMTRRAVRSNPLDPSFAIQLGNGLAGLGEGEKAARHFRRALAAAPGEAVAANNLANLLAGDPSAARRQYEHAVTAGAPYADAEERRQKAKRNYALEYVRTGLTVLAEALGPSRAAGLASHAGRLIGMQLGPQVAGLLGVEGDDPAAAARVLVALAEAEGDTARCAPDGSGAIVDRDGIRLFQGLESPSSAVFEGWNGLLDGLAMGVAGHVAVARRTGPDRGSAAWSWRIDPAAR